MADENTPQRSTSPLFTRQPPPTPRLRTLETLDDVVDEIADREPVYIRYSHGPATDAEAGPSLDYEAAFTLPGLSVASLTPEPWWTRSPKPWIARRIRKYAELDAPDRYAWLLAGEVVGRGPDHEPLVRRVDVIARLAPQVLSEAAEVYEEMFEAGRDSRADASDG